MSARVLSGYRHELQVYRRTTLSGHALATLVGAVMAAVAVFGFGI